MTSLHIDYETRSEVDLRAAGVYVYQEHESTDVWCAAYAIDDGPVKLWTPDGDQGDLAYVMQHADEFVAHNAAFERVIGRTMSAKYGIPQPKLEQWRCTMAMALALSLPGGLDNAASAVGMEFRKAEGGRHTMLQMSKPREPRKGEKPAGLLWWDDEDRKQKLYAYCRQDVVVERELDKRLLPLRPSEQRLWELDQRINDRGIRVDLDLCNAALSVVGAAAGWLNDEINELTGGAVDRTTNVAQIAKWCREQGFQVESLTKGAIDEILLRDDLTPVVRRVLHIRREAAKAAVKKIDALVHGRSADGRARGLLQFHAAGTGRWAGRRFQPQNIKRPELKNVDAAIDAVRTGSAEYVDLIYGEPLRVVGDCLRGLLVAPVRRAFYAADFSNIEGRLIAWLAGERWKLDAFRQFDAGTGPDIYKLAYARSFGVSVDSIDFNQRQVGKVMELALGYQGGVAAFKKMAVNYGVKVSDAKADELKTAWRDAHPKVCDFWYALEDGATRAITNRGTPYTVGRLVFRVVGSFLFMRLPSGRAIAYPYPRLTKVVWVQNVKTKVSRTMPVARAKTMEAEGKVVITGTPKDSITYRGVNPETHQWEACFAHGGLLCNNAVQGTARDIEAEAMERVEAAGYEVVLSVHDEVVSETAEDFGSVEEFSALMTVLPDWAQGCPIAAGGWKATRYHK